MTGDCAINFLGFNWVKISLALPKQPFLLSHIPGSCLPVYCLYVFASVNISFLFWLRLTIHLFLSLNCVLLYGCTRVYQLTYLSAYLLKIFGLLLVWGHYEESIYKHSHTGFHVNMFLLSIYLEIGLLGCMVNVNLTFIPCLTVSQSPWTTFYPFQLCIGGEGNSTPLQYSCLENPMDGGGWWATVHGVPRVGHGWATSLSLFTFMHWRRKWQPTPVFLPANQRCQE